MNPSNLIKIKCSDGKHRTLSELAEKSNLPKHVVQIRYTNGFRTEEGLSRGRAKCNFKLYLGENTITVQAAAEYCRISFDEMYSLAEKTALQLNKAKVQISDLNVAGCISSNSNGIELFKIWYPNYQEVLNRKPSNARLVRYV